MTAAETLRAEAAKRILIKDGPFGTAIQAEKLPAASYCAGLDLMKDQKGNNDLINLTQPQIIRSTCEAFADAGAEILATNTFNANSISQADFGAEHLVSDINRASAQLASVIYAERARRERQEVSAGAALADFARVGALH